jgi:hypothetical protein
VDFFLLSFFLSFNFQPTSSFLKSWWWKKELISADRQNNNKKNRLHYKNWQPFYGKDIHIYLQTKPLSPDSQEPRLPPYKSVMLCWQKHGWWKILETPDESCWHMPVSNSFVMRLECVDFMGFACCFTNQIGTLFCQERANKGGDISTWWANYVFCSDSCYNNLFLSYTLFCKWFSTFSARSIICINYFSWF